MFGACVVRDKRFHDKVARTGRLAGILDHRVAQSGFPESDAKDDASRWLFARFFRVEECARQIGNFMRLFS